MPVEDIKLAHLHEVQVISQDRLGDVVATGVHQDSPVSEARRVVDVGFFHKVLKTNCISKRTLGYLTILLNMANGE